jgi:hypothetical protein
MFGGTEINCPQFDVNGDRFVDPVLYYGGDYLKWKTKHILTILFILEHRR